MALFRFCDLTVESSFSFQELLPANGEKPDLLFQLFSEERRPVFCDEWLHDWSLPDGTP